MFNSPRVKHGSHKECFCVNNQDGGGHVGKGQMPFILIVGKFRLEQVNEILDGFLNRVMMHSICLVFEKIINRIFFLFRSIPRVS